MTLKEYLALDGNDETKLADSLGVAHSTIWRWANGKFLPSKEQMRAIFEETSGAVTPNDFYGIGDKAA